MSCFFSCVKSASAVLVCVLTLSTSFAASPEMVLVCEKENDLYRALNSNRIECRRYDDAESAVSQAKNGTGVLILADGYPDVRTVVPDGIFIEAKEKNLRLYIEYPETVPGQQFEAPRRPTWERTVVASPFFGESLPEMSILMIQNCNFLPTKAENPILVQARVAGYNKAALGLPEKDVYPILFQLPEQNVLVATTKLSQFQTGRYAPMSEWPKVWDGILRWFSPDKEITKLEVTPLVVPSFAKAGNLPKDAQREAVIRGTDWYTSAKMFPADNWTDFLVETAFKYNDRTGPAVLGKEHKAGDGKLGIFEAFSSKIHYDGSQDIRWFRRADCNSEASLALALRSKIDKNKRSDEIAHNLADFIFFNSPLQKGDRADPKHPTYGLIGWDDRPEGVTVFYGDDNARCMLGMIGTSSVLQDDRWDESMMKCILANFRTTSPYGFRNARIDAPEFAGGGWEHFLNKSDGSWGGSMKYSPHYQSYLWAVYLWAYDKTKYEPFLVKTKRAIGEMMERFPDRWDNECGRVESERARMLLPLAWLVRVDDTPEHREWLKKVASYIISIQDESGAIRQFVSHIPKSNEEFGAGEAPIIFTNGDPCTDLLYTTNFAMIGLHEAAAATGDPEIKAAEDRLADFLIRIQARCKARNEFDGTWFRGFDYGRWDYWGSNGDVGWGVWATETGWTQGWICTVLAMRELKTSLWDVSKNSRIGKKFPAIRDEMIGDTPIPVAPSDSEKIDHLAKGCVVALTPKPTREGATDPQALTNGVVNLPSHNNGKWIAYQGNDFEITVDLGKETEIREIGIHSIQTVPVGIFFPGKIEFSVSKNGKDFVESGVSENKLDPNHADAPSKWSTFEPAIAEKGRFVRFKLRNPGRFSDYDTWIFVDEISVK